MRINRYKRRFVKETKKLIQFARKQEHYLRKYIQGEIRFRLSDNFELAGSELDELTTLCVKSLEDLNYDGIFVTDYDRLDSYLKTAIEVHNAL